MVGFFSRLDVIHIGVRLQVLVRLAEPLKVTFDLGGNRRNKNYH
jgi:hypothetical protein